MTQQAVDVWRCGVCGYIHRGPEPPQWCPICGASREEFEPYVAEGAAAAGPKIERWRCLNCNYIHFGSQPPEVCPVCGAPADRFEPLGEAAEGPTEVGQAARVVIVGAGIAGLAAVESLRSSSPEAEITLISKEPELPYYRLNLTRYLAGELGEDTLPIHPASWYEEQHVQLLLGAEVSAIALEEHAVELRDGEKMSFEKLILTVGAHPFIPPIPGASREGVASLRTLEDAKRILNVTASGAKCVCIGGGLLGVETAGALVGRGCDVTLLESHGWLMPRQLNQKAGEMLERHVTSFGIKLRKEARTAEILGDERVRGVLLEDQTIVPAEVVVIATGIRPNSYLARLAGLEVNDGVIVDNFLASSHPSVLAAGDVAEHRGVVYGTWVPSRFQGSIAGMNAVGLATEFGGIPRSNTLKVLGFDMLSIGKIGAEDGSFRVIEGEPDGKYFRFVFRDTHLVGAILLGDATLTVPIKKAVENKTDFSGLLKRGPSVSDVAAHLAEETH